ncbi:MAG: hypothetical protein ACYCPR_02465 [Thermoplasmataceae archaeon]
MPKADINKEVIKSNEIYGKTGKNNLLMSAHAVDNFEKEMKEVVTGKKAVNEIKIDKYKAVAYTLIHDRDKYPGSFERLQEIKELFNQVHQIQTGRMLPIAEVVQFIEPLVKEYLLHLSTKRCVVLPLNVDHDRFFIMDPETKSAYDQSLKIIKQEDSDMDVLQVSSGDIQMKAFFENVKIFHPTLVGKARKVEFDAISSINSSKVHIGPATTKDAVSALEQLGLIMDRTHAMDIFTQAIAAYIETGNAEQLTGTDTPGFYKDETSGGIVPVGYKMRNPSKEEMRNSLVALNKIAGLFPKATGRFSSCVKWPISAPFSYYLRQLKIYPQHMMLYGITGTSKTALLLIAHGIWGLWDPETSNHGFFISGGEADTASRLGERLQQGTFPLVIDEGEGLFLKSDGRENVAVNGILKHALQTTVSRQTSDRGLFMAYASVAIATNVKPPRGAAPILSRMATIESGSREQIRAGVAEKERFQKLQNELYPQLEAVGQFVASKVIANPDILTADFESFGEEMLRQMYSFAEMEVPEWVSLHGEVTSIENLDMDVKEEIRVFLYKSNLEGYGRNIGRTGILKKSANGNEYPEYDDRTNVPASKKIEISIKSGLISWQVFKDTKGVQQVILTTAFAKEVSRIVGEAYNLQSIGELLGFENKVSRIGNVTSRTIVANLDDYINFLVPEVTFEPGDDASKIRGDLRTLKSNNPQVNEPSTTEESKEKIEKPWKTPDESNASVTSEASKDKTDTGPHEDPKKTEKAENAMDPVLKHLRDRTSERSNKFMTVYELYHALPLGCDWSEPYIYGRLEEQVRLGKVIRNGIKYAIKEFMDGSSETRTEPTVSSAPTGNPRYYTYRALKSFELNGRTYRAGIDFILTDYLKDLVDSGHLEVVT